MIARLLQLKWENITVLFQLPHNFPASGFFIITNNYNISYNMYSLYGKVRPLKFTLMEVLRAFGKLKARLMSYEKYPYI